MYIRYNVRAWAKWPQPELSHHMQQGPRRRETYSTMGDQPFVDPTTLIPFRLLFLAFPSRFFFHTLYKIELPEAQLHPRLARSKAAELL
jgi:hypothetical protein